MCIRDSHNLGAWTHLNVVDVLVEELFKEAEQRDAYVFSTDFSAYDQTIGPELMRAGFEVLMHMYQPGSDSDTLLELRDHISNIELMVQLDAVLTGTHGMPSGSVFTNFIDTVVHMIAGRYAARRNATVLGSYCQFQGDDGLWIGQGVHDVSDLTDAYTELGLSANPTKQFVGKQDCLYLQRYHIRGTIGGMYPTYRALNKLMGSERFHSPSVWGPDMVVLRSIMILENVKWHPLWKQLVDFTVAGDERYALGLLWPGGLDSLLFESDVLTRAGKSGVVGSYSQGSDFITGIRKFRTYEYLKEISEAPKPVSYTHLRAHEDRTRSRMPSSA